MQLTREQVDAYNALNAAGSAILNAHAFVDGQQALTVSSDLVRRRLKIGIDLYAAALKIDPEAWSSMWALGKLYQRLGDDASALKWFAEANRIQPDQVAILREAGLAALSVGARDEALKLCFAAVQRAPDDLGLQSNLALAYLLARDDEHAEECAKIAVSRAPHDATSREVLALVRDVRQGKRKRPERLG